MARGIAAVPVTLMLVIAFLAVPGGAARPLAVDGNALSSSPGMEGAIVPGDGVLQLPRQMYLKQLRGGALVRHQQLERWLPTVPMISSKDLAGLWKKNGGDYCHTLKFLILGCE
jgi:hypothetical protein